MPTTDSPAGADTPAPGTRIKVTSIGHPDDEPGLYVGAVGTVTEVGKRYVAAAWDDPEAGDSALLRGEDTWEVLAGA